MKLEDNGKNIHKTISESNSNKKENSNFSLPSISIPKGGGAIRGIGEKFSTNPVTGTGSLSVPIFTSPGRSGFGPSLSLSYDSGSGNGPFGFGWNLSLPSITRKTSKGIPRYQDTGDESDIFILSGAEDLVPVFKKDGNGEFEKDGNGNFVIDEFDRDGFAVRRYIPRTEGLFARIERWTKKTTGDVHWRSISKDNILTVYGRNSASRITDPSDESGTRIFSWLICQSYDDKGNAIVYEYVQEDENGIELDLLNTNELNRIRTANKYIKRIFYGNRSPLLIDTTRASFRKSHLEISDEDLHSVDWLFHVIFDYDEDHCKEIPLNPDVDPGDQHKLVEASLSSGKKWSSRPDPFSIFRSSFEIRTYRRCHRVLMFHHFPELGTEPYLVRSTEFNYADFDYFNPSFSLENELDHPGSTRIASFMQSMTQSGYRRDETKPIHDINGVNYVTYIKKSIPPLEFEYSKCKIQHEIKDVDGNTLENLPVGVDGRNYQFVDLDGEGISGILTEQENTWFYKPNLGNGKFGPIEVVETKPSIADLNSSNQHLMDLAGDGQLDLVETSGSISGFYERNQNSSWENFAPFESIPNVNWNDPNLRLVDLTGDGHADILITENEVFTWYQSLAEKGFKQSSKVIQELDKEKGPRLVLNKGSQSIYLADMSGDGLSDFVRITNGEVCYWPNLGYGRFGAKITMDNCPWFDSPDQFDNRNIRLADIDGSGVTDIIYLDRSENQGIKIYFNQSGNRWSDVYYLDSGLQIDVHSSIQIVDLLGNGTACLVWSSPLPGYSTKPIRYLDLMGGIKPHLLIRSTNNLGAETQVEYASSTKFYLADRAAGKPWITRMPFPIHVVERVITYDYISRNVFVTKSAYHHGYFDGVEQEFRGFGMVEQWDTEEFATLSGRDMLPIPNSVNIDEATHVPPVYSKNWYHTGIYLEREHISDYFGGLIDIHDRGEYYREPEWHGDDIKSQKHLLEDTILPYDLTIDEEFEACRTLRGSMLRQEIYALDGTEKEIHPYSVIEQNFTIKLVQPRRNNHNAVFFTHSRESVTYHYERKLFPVLNGKVIDADSESIDLTNPEIEWIADPRVQHSVTLSTDGFGNVIQSVVIGYGRRLEDPDRDLLAEDHEKQRLMHIVCTENKFTNSIIDKEDVYRTPLSAETSVYEVRKPEQEKSDNRTIKLFQFNDLLEYLYRVGDGHHDIDYRDIHFTKAKEAVINDHQAKNRYFRRLIEKRRTLYRPDDLGANSSNSPLTLLPLGTADSLALTGENFELAFTPDLLTQVFRRNNEDLLLPDSIHILGHGNGGDMGGYIQSQQLKIQGIFPNSDIDDCWWAPSGRVFMSPDIHDTAVEELEYAEKHFFLPLRFRDPFHTDLVNTESTIILDNYDLLMLESHDPLRNIVTVGHRLPEGHIDPDEPRNDYRILQPRLVTDPNGNRIEVVFDALGMVAGRAVKGKDSSEGDTLDLIPPYSLPFEADLTPNKTKEFYHSTNPNSLATDLLRGATTRIIYDLDCFRRAQNEYPSEPMQWPPIYASTLSRTTHLSDTELQDNTNIQISFSYSDGFGREIQRKIRAEPGPVSEGGSIINPRWVCSGYIVFDNKSNPISQYEPFFSHDHKFQFGVRAGVSSMLFYDPMNRVVATLHPNHIYEKVVFDPWRQVSYDANDTICQRRRQTGDPRTDLDIKGYVEKYFTLNYPIGTWNTWFEERQSETTPDEEKTAAAKAAVHADTPSIAYFDILGRSFLTKVHNCFIKHGSEDGVIMVDERYMTRIQLDIQGNQLEVRDAIVQNGDLEGRIVMKYDYNMLGDCIHQVSMEAGEYWMLNDVTGKHIRSWDSRNHTFRREHDPLRRQLRSFVTGADPANPNQEYLTERIVYGEIFSEADPHNMRGRMYLRLDQSGLVKNEYYDFKGNLLRTSRSFAKEYKKSIDWNTIDHDSLSMLESRLPSMLEDEKFISSSLYDALNRVTQFIPTHIDQSTANLNVIQPVYNEASLLQQIHVWLGYSSEPNELLDPTISIPSSVGLNNIEYNARGQCLRVDYKNETITLYSYDPQTFRLVNLLTLRDAVTFPDDCMHSPPNGWPGCQVQNLHYTYDPMGNITRIYDDSQQTIFFRNKRVEPSAEYIYDSLYRLIEATGREHLAQINGSPNPYSNKDEYRVGLLHPNDGNLMSMYTEQYIYDSVGNLYEIHHYRNGDLSDPGWTRKYEYDEISLIENGNQGTLLKTSNRLSRTIIHPHAPQPVIEEYAYDLHGNITSMPHLENMESDFHDQLKEIDMGGGGRAYYIYDMSGERVRKVWEKSPGLTTERIYFRDFELFRERNGSGVIKLERETLHVMDVNHHIALVEKRTKGIDPSPEQIIRYQYGNHLGSASLELDDNANIISYEEYTPYGSTSYQAGRSLIEVNTKRYRYTGKERDEESGLYYHGARYYIPWLARWTTCDPSGITAGINHYAYVRGNPIRRVDNDGHQDSELEPTLRYIQQIVDKIPQNEFKRLSSGERGTRAHLILEHSLTVVTDYAGDNVNVQRIAQEILIDKKGIIRAVGVDPGSLGSQAKKWRSIDAAILKEGVFHVQGPKGTSNLIGIKAKDVIQLGLDYKTGDARLRGKTGVEKLIGAPYIKVTQGGNLGTEGVTAISRGVGKGAKSRSQRNPQNNDEASASTRAAKTSMMITGVILATANLVGSLDRMSKAYNEGGLSAAAAVAGENALYGAAFRALGKRAIVVGVFMNAMEPEVIDQAVEVSKWVDRKVGSDMSTLGHFAGVGAAIGIGAKNLAVDTGEAIIEAPKTIKSWLTPSRPGRGLRGSSPDW